MRTAVGEVLSGWNGFEGHGGSSMAFEVLLRGKGPQTGLWKRVVVGEKLVVRGLLSETFH